MNLRDIAILNINIKSADYCCIISKIIKNEAISLMRNGDLTEKSTLWNMKNLLSYFKMAKEILMFGDNEIERSKFFHGEIPIFFKDVDIEKVPNNFFWWKKL